MKTTQGKVLPFLEEDYFTDNNEKIIYNHINEFVSNYSSLSSKEALALNSPMIK